MPKRRTLSEALARTERRGPAAAPPVPPEDGGSAARLIRPIDVTSVRIENRLRAVLDDAKIQALAASLATIGLMSPIVVRPSEPADNYVLVAGAHRLEAARRLGWELIDARVHTGSPDEMRLIEIDENLARAELTPLDRALFVTERKRVYLRMHPERTRGGDRRSAAYRQKHRTDTMSDRSPPGGEPDHPTDTLSVCPPPAANPHNQTATMSVRSFAADAGDRAGLTERTIYRALEIGEGLDPDLALALARTPLAHREGDLRRIAGMPGGEQRALIRAIDSLDEPPRTLRELPLAGAAAAGDASPPGPPAPALPALKRAWRRAGDAERQRFHDWIHEQGWPAAQ